MKKVVIITALPFRIQGNQSLLRFIKMFLQREIEVELYTSGTDGRGENVLQSKYFKLTRFTPFIRKIIELRKRENDKPLTNTESEIFTPLKSGDIIEAESKENLKTMIVKWIAFFAILMDNVLTFLYMLFFNFSNLKKADAIIGYEVYYGLCSKALAFVFNKKLIVKYQGTTLKAAERDISRCIKYYPYHYFGLVKADLVIMVNDGTDGEWYARQKGNKNVFFKPHGVGINDYNLDSYNNKKLEKLLSEYKEKDYFIISNLSTATRWKRPDRLVRFLSYLSEETRKKVIVFTTYFGLGKDEVISMAEELGVSKNIVFLENMNHIDCNYLLRNSHILLSTNDLCNLGNPTLEASYFGIPIVSINDGTIENIVENKKHGILIDLNEKFDKNLANTISKLVIDKEYYNNCVLTARSSTNVNSVQEQQKKEFEAISMIVEFN